MEFKDLFTVVSLLFSAIGVVVTASWIIGRYQQRFAQVQSAQEVHIANVDKLNVKHDAGMGELRTRCAKLELEIAVLQKAETLSKERAAYDAHVMNRLLDYLHKQK